jgi:type II secretory pathway component PulC
MAVLALISCSLILTPVSQAAEREGRGVKSASKQGRNQKEVTPPDIKRVKGRTIVSRSLADRIREDNRVVLSTVAIQATKLKNEDPAFKVVQIDKGAIAERLGFKAGDIVWKVNGLDLKTAEGQFDRLEKLDEFEVLVLRGGKKKLLRFEIR